jgi:hypothetical protein
MYKNYNTLQIGDKNELRTLPKWSQIVEIGEN